VRCNCGHRVISKDVLQTGLYLNLVGPSFVYVRFRCARCKRVGEQLIQEDRWDPAVLTQPLAELSESERSRFTQLGPITPEEVLEFHQRLEQLENLDRALPASSVEGDEQKPTE